MKIKDWLAHATKQLEKVGIGSARLDALILLEDSIKKDRSWILANPDYVISNTKLKGLSSRLKKRSTHLPLAFVRGHTEFYGRKFLVNKYTLEPRPESETMIELLLKLPISTKVNIADVGAGSGALGILHRFYWKPKFVLCESLPTQHTELAKIAGQSGFSLFNSEDFIQVFEKRTD
jgi:release factor glutamine methyltransferase